MPNAVILDAVRTGGGKRNGKLRGWHPADLAAEVLKALVARNDLDPALIDDVILGCVTQVGEQALNVARNAVLAAGFPETVPATTVDRQCGSSQQAADFAAQAVMAGAYDLVVAGGVEAMTRVPMGASLHVGGIPFGPSLVARYAERGGLVPQGIAAELVAEQWGLFRAQLDAYAARSQRRAADARDRGAFGAEIVPVTVRDEHGNDTAERLDYDEGIRADTTEAVLATLKPAFKPDGMITAGNSSQITDAAAALLIASEEKAAELGLEPMARFHTFALAGVDPITMLTAPAPATRKALERAKLELDDIDVIEVNEAFASVVLAWESELRPDMSRVNPNGGAIALGHPLGCSGARLMTTLVHELGRCHGRYGLQTMCEGGGMANATILERL
jgi:acetyl-CoA acyltransferase